MSRMRDDLAYLNAPIGLLETARLKRELSDLRDRLSLFAGLVCRACGCAPYYVRQEHCLDCWEVRRNYHGIDGSGSHVSSCISVGLRALCGRRLLDGGEIQK